MPSQSVLTLAPVWVGVEQIGSPLVSFNLQSDPYGDHMLIIEGTAAEDRTVPSSEEHTAYAAKYREPLQHWEMSEAETARDFSVPIRITPRRIRLA